MSFSNRMDEDGIGQIGIEECMSKFLDQIVVSSKRSYYVMIIESISMILTIKLFIAIVKGSQMFAWLLHSCF